MLKKVNFTLLPNYCFICCVFLISVAFVSGVFIASAFAAKEEQSAVVTETKKSASDVKRKTGSKININKADQATLEKLPGIGPGKAKAIIDNRPYKKIEDVMRVSDIKKRTYDTIKDEIAVE